MISVQRKDRALTVKADDFMRAMRDVHATLRANVTFEQVVDHEIGRVCEKALEDTGRATAENIRTNTHLRPFMKEGGKTYVLWNWATGKEQRVPNRIYQMFVEQRRQRLIKKLAAIGITKRSWLELANKVGVSIRAPGIVQRAMVRKDTSANTKTKRESSGRRFGRVIVNKHPLLDVPGTQSVRAFFGALAGRVGFFRQNLARGVFDSAKATLSKYKGFRVTPKG